MQNLHKHSYYSNMFSADAIPSYEEYAKRALEVGHKVLSSVEHGWQGLYHETYEIAKKHDLKCVIGTEAYWMKNRHEQDKSNHHIIICAKSNMGREAINDILSEANISGYYYRPRIDLELLFSLPPKDVFITSACIAFSGYEDVNSIIKQMHDYFGENFMLEVQPHHTLKQVDWHKNLLQIAQEEGIELFAGIDSHYIYPQDNILREDLLLSKGIRYENEDDWFMDYPDDTTLYNRFLEQGVLTGEQITKAMNNTDIALDFCDYDGVRIFTKDIKLPSIYPDKTQEEKNQIYTDLINDKLEKYLVNVPEEKRQEYRDGVKAEVQTYIDTGMVDYPLLDYTIVNDAIQNGCLVTATGRGSAVGFFTNTLCGFSSVDRFTSAIKLYPERFISTTRILETHSLPDIDLNTGTPEILEESQKKIMGDNHAISMFALGTLKKNSAFKMYAKSQGLEFELANEISNQIKKYDEAVKNADDEDKDDIDIYDYVDKKYQPYIEQSAKYWGIVIDKKKAPSAYLLYDGDIRKEIGLIKCKSESTGKEYITCCINGNVAENYKFLKNDILKVDVVLLINKVFQRIGIPQFGVNELINKVTNDPKVWALYKNGYTMGLNQVEKPGTTNKCMRYAPSNVSEMSAFVAAVRPGFKSMYSRYENRENFSWGIPALDNLIRTEELPVSFLFFQEQVMSVLNYAGFPMDECYGIIKAIAKKHPEKVKPLKERFIEGFKNKLILDEKLSEQDAQTNAEKVWTIVNDNCGYGFNSAHAFSVALDSLYQAWQKANYPYEFYEVLLNHYSEKGKKEKVAALKKEMKKAFEISTGEYKFGRDNRGFVSDKNKNVIYPSMKAIKGLNAKIAEELYELSQTCLYNNYIQLLEDITTKISCNSKQLDILIRLNYFSDFGEINELLFLTEQFNKFYNKGEGYKKNIKASKAGILKDILPKYCEEHKPAVVKEFNMEAFTKWAHDLPQVDNEEFDKLVEGCKRYTRSGDFKDYNYEKLIKAFNLHPVQQERFATKISEEEFKGVDARQLLLDLKYKGKSRSIKDIVKDQQEFLSYIDYIDPSLSPRYVVVTNLNTTYSPAFDGYCLKSGEVCTFKVHSKNNPKATAKVMSFKMLPFEDGDILYIDRCSMKNRVRKGQKGEPAWVEIPDEWVYWADVYSIANLSMKTNNSVDK